MNRYSVYCEVYPRSGFELLKSNQFIKELGNDPAFWILKDRGMILKTFEITTEREYRVSEVMVMIREHYPEAVLVAGERVIIY